MLKKVIDVFKKAADLVWNAIKRCFAKFKEEFAIVFRELKNMKTGVMKFLKESLMDLVKDPEKLLKSLESTLKVFGEKGVIASFMTTWDALQAFV